MIKLLTPFVFLLANCKEPLKVKSSKKDQYSNTESVICKENPRVINNELLCIDNIDSLSAYYQLNKWEDGKWEIQIDSIYVFQFFEFTDINLDGYRDLAIFYKRGFCVYFYNLLKNKFEKESVGFSNNYELIDSSNKLYCNNPLMPYDERGSDLFKIKDYKQQYQYTLTTEEDSIENGNYKHILYKIINNQFDSLEFIRAFSDKNNHISFDYSEYWKTFVKTELHKIHQGLFPRKVSSSPLVFRKLPLPLQVSTLGK